MFETLPERSTAADVDPTGWLTGQIALGMVAEPGPCAYAKTGEQSYQTDQEVL